jgi:3-hydroxy-9,10-secoandrosta-1,3,5(10)-triene-9,17-dione monooxygenase reductase component
MDVSRKFRQCLGKFATGVTVVTCRDRTGKPCGITANSFSSVSLSPPLILWNIAKVSRSLQAYLNAEFFAINILSREQQAIAHCFARSEGDLFKNSDIRDSVREVPLLNDTLAYFECRTQEVHDCGDHHIIIGEVVDYHQAAGEPLIFYSGEYTKL